MSLGMARTLGLLHRQFSHYPAAARLHILIRFFTCPFLRTLGEIPAGARMLDIGAGHGTFARLAIEQGVSTVIAVEPDIRKTLLPFRHPSIHFVAGFDDCIRGEFDFVVIFDVMYRMSDQERQTLLQRAWDRLRPGGRLLLKDLDPTSSVKLRWARLQEQISDRFLGISIGEGFLHETPAQVERRLTEAGFSGFRARRVDFGYPHAHIVYTAEKPAAATRRKADAAAAPMV